MDDNKQITQDVNTAKTSTNEGQAGGKTFTQDQLNEIVSQRLKEEKAKADETVKNAVAEAIAEERRQAKLSEEEREKEAKSKYEAELKARENDLILRGDVERAYLEWKSMLRHITHLPHLENERWLSLQALASKYV